MKLRGLSRLQVSWAKTSKKLIRKPKRRLAAKRRARPPRAQSAPEPQDLTTLPTVELPETTQLLVWTTDLLHPSFRLQSSLEGFFLDQRSDHTRRAYSRDFKRFLKYLVVRKQERGVERLERGVFIGYKEFLLSEALEHTTIDRHLACLRSLFAWFIDDGLMSNNPVEKVRFLNPRKISKTVGFSDVEVRRILSQPDLHTRTGALHYAILAVLFYCGLRRSEAASLRTQQISSERGHLVLRLRGKGNAERLITLPDAVTRALHHHLRMNGKSVEQDSYLFTPIRNNRTHDLEKAIDPSQIYYVVTKYAKNAGITQKVSPHSCRATAISNARDHHVPDRAIQEFAGWSSTEMITRYDKRRTSIENSASLSIDYSKNED